MFREFKMAVHQFLFLFAIILASLQVGFCYGYPEGCTCLKNTLHCFGNNMTNLPTNSSMPDVTVFNMSSNKIDFLPEKVFLEMNLTNLKTIDLSQNSISVVDPNAFDGLSILEYLYLQGNKIEKIQSGTFFSLTKLTVLQLHNNNIKEIEKSTFNMQTALKTLSVSGLQGFDEDVFEPLSALKQLKITFFLKEGASCEEQNITVVNWSSNKNITVDFKCFKGSEREVRRYPIVKHNMTILHDKSMFSSEFVIGIVITVGVVLLIAFSLVLLAIIIRQSERITDDRDDYSYMSDFEPYRGQLSPLKAKEFRWSNPRENPMFLPEKCVSPNTNFNPNGVNGPHRVSFEQPENLKNVL